MRVVSLVCSNTEIVCRLGCEALLCGVDANSDFPSEVVAALPKVGRDLEIEPQKVAALRPDLVLASLTVPGHERVLEALHAEGIPFEILAPRSLADGLSWIHDLLLAAGARHPLASEEVESRPMTDEEVFHAAPDAIILSWCGVKEEKYRPDVIYRNEAWKTSDFVAKRRVFCVGEPFLGRPGPRLVEGYRALRAIVGELS